MLAPSFITLWRAWQTEHVPWGLHQPLACCSMQFSQMYQSSRRDPAIWTAFTASWANSQEMFNNVPCTSVARSRFLERRVAKRNPGSASLQLLVTRCFCCYCLRACFCKGSPRLRSPKAGFKVSWTCPSGSWWRGWMWAAGSLECSWIWAQGWGSLPADRAGQSWVLQQPKHSAPHAKGISGVWAVTEQMPVQIGNLVGLLATSLGYRIQSGVLTASVLQSKRGSAEYSPSTTNCLTLK